jgi:hypothetical protein
VALDEITLESFFPADEVSAARLRALCADQVAAGLASPR